MTKLFDLFDPASQYGFFEKRRNHGERNGARGYREGFNNSVDQMVETGADSFRIAADRECGQSPQQTDKSTDDANARQDARLMLEIFRPEVDCDQCFNVEIGFRWNRGSPTDDSLLPHIVESGLRMQRVGVLTPQMGQLSGRHDFLADLLDINALLCRSDCFELPVRLTQSPTQYPGRNEEPKQEKPEKEQDDRAENDKMPIGVQVLVRKKFYREHE